MFPIKLSASNLALADDPNLRPEVKHAMSGLYGLMQDLKLFTLIVLNPIPALMLGLCTFDTSYRIPRRPPTLLRNHTYYLANMLSTIFA
jgi:hypothetical protein